MNIFHYPISNKSIAIFRERKPHKSITNTSLANENALPSGIHRGMAENTEAKAIKMWQLSRELIRLSIPSLLISLLFLLLQYIE